MKLPDSATRNRRRRAVAIVEVTIGLSGLVVVGFMLLKAALSATVAQRWTIIQGMTDAYMTRESAIAKRMPFEDLTATTSPWPIYPEISEDTVEIGRLPGGTPVMAVVRRTRVPGADNLPDAGGGGNTAVNPAKMEVWSLQSLLSYELSSRDYVKSRTVVRSR